ncbi:MAG TPA: ABC transporter permease [Intrasporangium sp.]|jgi:hypothetical protein|uniref:ABC transporter permease n=1 Tax=Intrasporangium sp. TaxID=1925024 RepID=UPI002F9247A5
MRTVLAPALRAEWIKATSLRSIWLCLAIFVVGVAGIGIAVVASIGDVEARQPDYDPSTVAFYGLNFGHVAVIVLAVLLTAGEYNRHTIHASLVAVPKRAAFLAAKLGVGAVLVLLASAFAVPLTLLTARAVLGPTAVPVTEPAMLRSAVAAVLYVTLLTVLCMNIAMLIRNQAGAIGLLVPFFFLLSPLLELVPVVQEAAAFLPDRAGATALRLESRPTDPFGPLTAMGVVICWAVASGIGAWAALRHRDA